MRGRLAQNAILATSWQAIRVLSQAAWVITVARLIGASEFGGLAGLSGLATSMAGVSGLGTAMLMVKRVAIDHSRFGHFWRLSLPVTLISGCALSLLFPWIASTFLAAHITLGLVAAVAFSELLCTPLVTLASLTFQAHERMGWCSAVTAIASLARLGAALAFWLMEANHNLSTYAKYHAISGLAAAFLALTISSLLLRPPSLNFSWSKSEAIEGLGFSALWFTSTAVSELDKTVTLHFGGGEVAGIYSAAYRFTNVLSLPVASLVMAMQPRLFRAAANGESMSALLNRAVLAILGYAFIGIFLLQIIAPALPLLLGETFRPSVDAARFLALIIPFYGLRLLGTSVLTAIGHQGLRGVAECVSLLAMFLSAMLFVPRYGVVGAIATIIGTETFLAALAWCFVWTTKKRD
jgi:O-antigen/teichoic acid export membrane protein